MAMKNILCNCPPIPPSDRCGCDSYDPIRTGTTIELPENVWWEGDVLKFDHNGLLVELHLEGWEEDQKRELVKRAKKEVLTFKVI